MHQLESPTETKSSGCQMSQPRKVEQGGQVDQLQSWLDNEVRESSLTHAKYREEIPSYLKTLYGAASKGCEGTIQARKQVRLITEFEIFSTGDADVVITSLVDSGAPVENGTHPIQPLPHRLGSGNEAKTKRQVQELFKKRLVKLL